jgi:hypothetical protein
MLYTILGPSFVASRARSKLLEPDAEEHRFVLDQPRYYDITTYWCRRRRDLTCARSAA